MISPAMATVIIADDEPLARERLRWMIRSNPDFHLVGEAANGPDAVRLIRDRQPRVAILDIRLPGLDGFGILRELEGSADPAVIFVTAFAEHALDAFQAGAVDYLLKPFEPRRLNEALNRARNLRMIHPDTVPEIPAPDVALPDRLALRVSGRLVVVTLDDVECLLAANNQCEVFTKGGSSFMTSESLGNLTTRLPAGQFVRVSRFAVVQISAVVSVTSKSHGDQLLQIRSGRLVTVARTCRAEVLMRLRKG